MSFDDACADVVISSAVLHFARDDAHFESILLEPGALLSLASSSSAASHP
ncbi:MAG TPA: hypothetical protein VNJ52_13440 [Patescibacteria group bacterium]|nr:hypothetical protein [Patescibacteria group bacterium]